MLNASNLHNVTVQLCLIKNTVIKKTTAKTKKKPGKSQQVSCHIFQYCTKTTDVGTLEL